MHTYKCQRCGGEFQSTGYNASYCGPCRAVMARERSAASYARRRAKVLQLSSDNRDPRATDANRCELCSCFGNTGLGSCGVLSDSHFNHTCPFFKTKEKFEADHAKSMERLRQRGRIDLIAKYVPPKVQAGTEK